MACPITVTKFVGTVSLGILTVSITNANTRRAEAPSRDTSTVKLTDLNNQQGLSFSTPAVTVPALKLLPTATIGSRSLSEVKRLNRKYALRLSSLANTCLFFAYTLSSARRKHPFLVWMCVLSTTSSYGLDLLFNRHLGLKNWILLTIQDTTGLNLGCSAQSKDEDLVMVENEDVNGESVQREMDREGRMQYARACLSGIAMSMGVIGLWGDKK